MRVGGGKGLGWGDPRRGGVGEVLGKVGGELLGITAGVAWTRAGAQGMMPNASWRWDVRLGTVPNSWPSQGGDLVMHDEIMFDHHRHHVFCLMFDVAGVVWGKEEKCGSAPKGNGSQFSERGVEKQVGRTKRGRESRVVQLYQPRDRRGRLSKRKE